MPEWSPPYAEAYMAARLCKIREWHPTTRCENSEEETVRQFRKLKSDLFKPSGGIPAPQQEIMNRNYSASPFLRLPPELRLRIYKLVLGRQEVWIAQSDSKVEWKTPEQQERLRGIQGGQSGQYFHQSGRFYHCTLEPYYTTYPFKNVLSLSLLRVCRHVYTETALLPYAFNTFTFNDDRTRWMFEKSTRPGKKRVQKKAIGRYKIGRREDFRASYFAEERSNKP